MKVPSWVAPTLLVLFMAYWIMEGSIALAQKSAALDYWNHKEPDKHHLFTIMLGTHIPMAIYCWNHYDDPMATWKMLDITPTPDLMLFFFAPSIIWTLALIVSIVYSWRIKS